MLLDGATVDPAAEQALAVARIVDGIYRSASAGCGISFWIPCFGTGKLQEASIMQKYQIPWGQWYEQSTRTLTFPDDWDVRYCAMQHLETLTKEQILDKLDHPIGSDTLETLAANKKSACIIIDDISRPTPGALLLPMIIKKLVDAGMDDSQIKVLIALGGHRPMTRQEMTIKVGSGSSSM